MKWDGEGKKYKVMASHRMEFRDPYSSKYWTALVVSILSPSLEHPYPGVHVSLGNGKNRTLVRFRTLEDVRKWLKIPKRALKRLESAYREAEYEANRIEDEMRLIFEKRKLRGEDRIVKTGTGEILAEAERIVNGKNT